MSYTHTVLESLTMFYMKNETQLMKQNTLITIRETEILSKRHSNVYE